MNRKYGLIGFPLGHSFSKKYFTEKFQTESLDAEYELYELKNITEFERLKAIENLWGINVTIPYKEQIIPLLDELDATASAIGAVNVVKFIRENDTLRLRGYNSDAYGFEKSIAPHLCTYHRKALILGTGGASKAVEYSLKKLGVEVKFVSRNGGENKLKYEELDEAILNDYLVVVNASPVGTFPHVNASPAIPYHALNSLHLLYDLVYNPSETEFMKKGKTQGAATMNGAQMLTLQAEEAWRIWNLP